MRNENLLTRSQEKQLRKVFAKQFGCSFKDVSLIESSPVVISPIL